MRIRDLFSKIRDLFSKKRDYETKKTAGALEPPEPPNLAPMSIRKFLHPNPTKFKTIFSNWYILWYKYNKELAA